MSRDKKKGPVILFENDEIRTWRDINGTMWRLNKRTDQLYQFIGNEWIEIVSALLKVLTKNESDFV